ncbi:MAG: recombinase zinc beta ribbon domain-containing protein [Oscillospiraceae bacterium]
MKVNEGEVPQYYVENSHPAIVTPETFDLVQHELSQRKGYRGYKASDSPFSGKVICGECDGVYGSKVWHSTSKYRRTIWQCNHKYKGKKMRHTASLRSGFAEGFCGGV